MSVSGETGLCPMIFALFAGVCRLGYLSDRMEEIAQMCVVLVIVCGDREECM